MVLRLTIYIYVNVLHTHRASQIKQKHLSHQLCNKLVHYTDTVAHIHTYIHDHYRDALDILLSINIVVVCAVHHRCGICYTICTLWFSNLYGFCLWLLRFMCSIDLMAMANLSCKLITKCQ